MVTPTAKPYETKVRAVAQANLIRPRYTNLWSGQAPGDDEAYDLQRSNGRMHLQGSLGVIEDGAYRKVAQEPGRPHLAPTDWQHRLGNHNRACGLAGESEKLIVALKPRNWGGAKGLYCKRDFAKMEGDPLVYKDHYGNMGI